MTNYYTLATPLRPDEVDEIARGLEAGTLRPMDAKKRLAEEITAVFHGRPAAEAARAYFESTFQRRETPDEMPEHRVSEAASLTAVLVAAGLAASNGEVRRLVAQGAVSVNGNAVTDATAPVRPGDEIRVGRHRFLRLVQA
jgi:tyrosyl-tRNA synthetase